MDKTPPTVADIEIALRLYLQAHPHAVDTERGIREWWLLGAGACRPDDVHIAIQQLVASGAMVERQLPDGQRAFARPSAAPTRPAGPP